MKPNDKAYREFMRVYNKTHVSLEAQIMASLTAAYAAQFQSEDYAGLIARLRKVEPDLPLTRWHRNPDGPAAADALEALLAERDALKAENDQHKSVYQKYVEAIDRMNGTPCEQVRHHYEVSELRSELALAVSERDALAARLAPVDDEALVEMAAVAIRRNKFERTGRLDCFDPSNLTPEELGEGRAAIAAVRPHIEAAERERCAKIAAEGSFAFDIETWINSTKKEMTAHVSHAIAAAIRRGK